MKRVETAPAAGQKQGINRTEPAAEELLTIERELKEEPETADLSKIDYDDPLGSYLREVHKVPLLTAQEEIDLAKRMEKGQEARETLSRETTGAKRSGQLYFWRYGHSCDRAKGISYCF